MNDELEFQAAFSVLSDKPVIHQYNDMVLIFIDGMPFLIEEILDIERIVTIENVKEIVESKIDGKILLSYSELWNKIGFHTDKDIYFEITKLILHFGIFSVRVSKNIVKYS